MWERELAKKKNLLALNIKRIRLEHGLAQERLALEAGVDRTLVSKIERVVANPSLEVLVKLATALQVSTQALLSEES
ncbi:helix-turn-helix domain-containing protein [Polynucleobacter yangtzensis]|uniref:helix-turn-helix domain-containing protein n=1 Tax=Polynucleobacter yangtzensis TaxID=1743159 RepID=UPI000831BCD9|nr:helix-turn-helix transcriptional regulator [Polynucleobacter yangtzensis]